MPQGVENKRFRDTMLSFVNRKNGTSGIRLLTEAMREEDALILGRLETLPQGEPNIIQDADTGAFDPLPGYDSPYTP